MSNPKPVVLCILDGWGERPETEGNAPALANTPNIDAIWGNGTKSTLVTFGPDVGLPTGQMGNSEVGHTNIGAGRVVAMDLGQIDLAIEDGSFFTNDAILKFIETLKASGGRAHLMGVVSDGGVHGHIEHLLAASKMIAGAGVPVVVHAITDGRDVAPDSAQRFIDDLVARLPENCTIATVIGRYFAMDRDNRWDRVARAYDAMIKGAGEHAATPSEAGRAKLCARRVRRVHPAHGDRRLHRGAGWRRPVLPEFPGRSGAGDSGRDRRPGFRRVRHRRTSETGRNAGYGAIFRSP